MMSVAMLASPEYDSDDDPASTPVSKSRPLGDNKVGVDLTNHLHEDGKPQGNRSSRANIQLQPEAGQELGSESGPRATRSETSQFLFSSVPMAGLPLAGAMFGLCLGGPVGLLAGVKLGGVTALGGSILGYTGASVIKEQREVRKHIDDHYKKDPDLFVRTPKQEATINRRRLSEQTTHRTVSRHRAGSLQLRGSSGSRKKSKSKFLASRSFDSSPLSQRIAHKARKHSSVSTSSMQRKRYSDQMLTKQPRLQPQQFTRLGDLSEGDQKAVLALICKVHVCQAPKQEILEKNSSDGKQKRNEKRNNTGASSLPDVLEEDSCMKR